MGDDTTANSLSESQLYREGSLKTRMHLLMQQEIDRSYPFNFVSGPKTRLRGAPDALVNCIQRQVLELVKNLEASFGVELGRISVDFLPQGTSKALFLEIQSFQLHGETIIVDQTQTIIGDTII